MTEFILALLQKKNKLKLTTLYQVLIGKKTSSVLSYAFFMELLPYLGCLPHLTEKQYEQEIDVLIKQKQLRIQEGVLYLEEQGTLSFLETDDYQHINYFRFGRKDETAWRLIQYFIQQLTQTTPMRDLEMTPYYLHIIERALLKEKNQKRHVFDELHLLFSRLPTEQSNLLVGTLSGGTLVGETFYQLFPEVNTVKGQLYRASAWHFLYQMILTHPNYTLYQIVKQPFFETLNQSVLTTRKMFFTTPTIESIAKKRGLKASTIRDHLIEWAILDEQFPFEHFDFSLFEQSFFTKEHIYLVSYKEVQERLGIPEVDFLTYRLYQIKRKRETLAKIRTTTI